MPQASAAGAGPCVEDGQIVLRAPARSSSSIERAELLVGLRDRVQQLRGRAAQSRTRPRRIGPCASAVENSELPAWLTHDCQNRMPSSVSPGGL